MPLIRDTPMRLPLDWYRQMRQNQPIYLDPRMRSWMVFRYSDALQVLLDHTTFSSDLHRVSAQLPNMPGILSLDEPKHQKLRSIVQKAFTPRIVEQLAPRITEITTELLDVAQAKGEMESIAEFAYPLPLTVIAELLGVPLQDRAQFRTWSQALATGHQFTGVPSPTQERLSSTHQLRAYFARQLEERRKVDKNDLMSLLLAAEVDGERLSEEELLDFCQLLLIAGHETTANLLGNALYCFDAYPEVAEELRRDPTLMPGAIEEILRCFPSVTGDLRITTSETEMSGQMIGKHQLVIVVAASANYDEEQFSEPEIFDIRRHPNRHITFGHGIHFCLGAPLARLEAKIALSLLLERFTSIKHVPKQLIEPIESPFLLGMKRFDVSLT
ncbi:MAG: cytochrome P450 [Chloroflexota bacterium]|nr:cytochrome P450 [Chloroflexota bacterium]